MPPRARPRPTSRQLALDGFVAVLLAGLTVGSVWLNANSEFAEALPAPTTATYLTGALVGLVLAVRRFAPLTVLGVCTLAFGVFRLVDGVDGGGATVALFLALTWAGLDDRRRLRDALRGICVVGLMGLVLYSLFLAGDGGTRAGPIDVAVRAYAIVINVFYLGAAWILGDQLRLKREREEALAARTLELEAERERSAERAAIAERLRIARELHDVLGHHVSVMGVQAGAARRILGRDPDRAAEALQQIEGSSRQAVTELQRVLALLREEGDDPRGPQPAPVKLRQIAADVRAAGVEVTVQLAPLPELPASLDLAVTRVVQESLTNTLRHGGPGTSAWVRVRTVDDGIEVEVVDDGRGEAAGLDGGAGAWSTGHGLLGMRERVELHGGRFTAGPVAPDGYRVRAWLPLPTSAVHEPSPPVASHVDEATSEVAVGDADPPVVDPTSAVR